MLRWLKLDAKNRAWRTLVQGFVVAVLGAAGDAVLQVLQRAVAGQAFDWREVLTTAAYAAGTAALMAAAAYLHRYRVDPVKAIPSAQPPRPMGATEAQAPATAPVPAWKR